MIALAWCWLLPGTPAPGAVLWIATVLQVYAVLRLMALAYISVFLGPFDSRMVLSTYVIGSIVAPLLVVEALRVRRVRSGITKGVKA
jgi:hypothetical protein